MVARFDKTSVKEMENTVKRLQHWREGQQHPQRIVKSRSAVLQLGVQQNSEYGYASKKRGRR